MPRLRPGLPQRGAGQPPVPPLPRPGRRGYRGRLKFRKHFLGTENVPAFDGSQDGEEVQCAAALDSLSEVKFWLRNVARHPNSFWLPTSTDKFYPDFVALLNDGRLLVAEYKGAHLVA